MCLSRVGSMDDICVTQPYAPTLFSMGDLPGPVLLLKFQRGEIEQKDLETEWKKLRPSTKRNRDTWPEDMPLYCRGCSERWNEDVERKLSEFPQSGQDQLWETVVALGMERFCKECQTKRMGSSTAEQTGSGTATDANNAAVASTSSKGNGEDPASDASTATCRYCKQLLPRTEFPAGTEQLCGTCMDLKLPCVKCSKDTGRKVMSTLRDYDIDHLLWCKKTHDLTRQLKCKRCTPLRADDTRYVWQQDQYECTSCHKSKLPRAFDTTVLRQLEMENKLYKACCYECKKVASGKHISTRHKTGAHSRWSWSDDKTFLVQCYACKRSLPVTSFSAARQRKKDYKSWACLECEYPDCTECKMKPPRPYVGSYTCTSCLYPPCTKCGKARPHNGKYSVHKMKHWICAGCKGSAN